MTDSIIEANNKKPAVKIGRMIGKGLNLLLKVLGGAATLTLIIWAVLFIMHGFKNVGSSATAGDIFKILFTAEVVVFLVGVAILIYTQVWLTYLSLKQAFKLAAKSKYNVDLEGKDARAIWSQYNRTRQANKLGKEAFVDSPFIELLESPEWQGRLTGMDFNQGLELRRKDGVPVGGTGSTAGSSTPGGDYQSQAHYPTQEQVIGNPETSASAKAKPDAFAAGGPDNLGADLGGSMDLAAGGNFGSAASAPQATAAESRFSTEHVNAEVGNYLVDAFKKRQVESGRMTQAEADDEATLYLSRMRLLADAEGNYAPVVSRKTVNQLLMWEVDALRLEGISEAEASEWENAMVVAANEAD
jgi:hypothetical protein